MKKCSKTGILFSNQLVIVGILLASLSSCDQLIPDRGLLSRLQNYQYISIDFNADINSNSSTISFSSLSVDNSPPLGSTQKCPLEWDGVSFSTTFDYSWELLSGEQVHSYGTITGTMSADGTVMESLTVHETSLYPETGDVFLYDISVIDVPYMPDYEYDEYSPRFGAEGQTVSQYIYAYAQSWEFTDDQGAQQTLYSTTVIYDNPDDEPYLHITFSGEK